jgi:hypothetical protein
LLEIFTYMLLGRMIDKVLRCVFFLLRPVLSVRLIWQFLNSVPCIPSFFPGNKVGKSLLIDDGALPWIVKNANNEAAPIRRHIELALCHLAQHGITLSLPLTFAHIILYAYSLNLLSCAEVNSRDIISEGALWELVRISRDCSREDIRMLAHRTLTSSPTLQAEMRRLGIKM